MLVPQLYRAGSAEQVSAVVSRHPLALLVTNGNCVPFATHLPVVAASDSCPADLTGQTMLGHMNRANPHWRALTAGTGGKLIFSGPNAYISPTLYETDPAAPTWDFVTVHLYGTIRPIYGKEDTLAVVRRTAAIFESSFGGGWDQESSVDYFREMVGRVGAFEFLVDSTEAMFKLSQEKEPEIQQRLIDEFTAAPPGSSLQQLGRLICEFGRGMVND